MRHVGPGGGGGGLVPRDTTSNKCPNVGRGGGDNISLKKPCNKRGLKQHDIRKYIAPV